MDTEIFFENSDSISLERVNSDIKDASASKDKGFGVRVYDSKKIGFSFCQKKEDVQKTIEYAKRCAQYSDALDFSFPTKRPKSGRSIKPLACDERDLKSIVDEVARGIATKTSQMRIVAQTDFSQVSIQNPSFEAEYSQNQFSIYAESLCDGGSSSDHFYGTGIISDPYDFGKTISQRAFEMKSAGKPSKKTYGHVVFGIRALEGLIELLSYSFHADRIRKGVSHLNSPTKFSRLFSLYENPLLEHAVPRPFDDEGVGSYKKSLVTRGAVGSILMDRVEASRSKKSFEQCGSCSRIGYESPPHISSTYLEIPSGTYSSFEDELEGSLLVIESIHGLHTANPTTGDFGVESNEAYEIVGNVKLPVRGFLVADNVYKLLSDKLLAFEKAPSLYGSLYAPRMACTDVQVVC